MRLSTIALRNLSRNRRRSVLSAVAIAVAAAAISFLFALLAGYTADMKNNLTSYYTGAVRIRNSEYDRYDYLNPLHLSIQDAGKTVSALESIPGVSEVSPRIPFPAAMFEGEKQHRIAGIGVDFQRERSFQNIDSVLLAGRLPEPNAREALIGAGLADRIEKSIGDTITVMTSTKYRSSNAMSFEVVGILGYPVGALNETQMLVPLGPAQRLTRMTDEVTEVLIKTEPEIDADVLARRIEADFLPEGIIAQSWKDINASYEIMKTAEATYNLIGLVFVILGSTVVINTTMMVIFERLREIGTLAALGMSGRRMVILFFLESLFLALVGGAAGVGLGTAVAWPLSIVGINLGSMMEGVDFELSNIIRPEVTITSTLIVFIATVAIASFATLIVARRAAKVDPVEALSAP